MPGAVPVCLACSRVRDTRGIRRDPGHGCCADVAPISLGGPRRRGARGCSSARDRIVQLMAGSAAGAGHLPRGADGPRRGACSSVRQAHRQTARYFLTIRKRQRPSKLPHGPLQLSSGPPRLSAKRSPTERRRTSGKITLARIARSASLLVISSRLDRIIEPYSLVVVHPTPKVAYLIRQGLRPGGKAGAGIIAGSA